MIYLSIDHSINLLFCQLITSRTITMLTVLLIAMLIVFLKMLNNLGSIKIGLNLFKVFVTLLFDADIALAVLKACGNTYRLIYEICSRNKYF